MLPRICISQPELPGTNPSCRRRVLGRAMAARLDPAWPEAALRQALTRRGRPQGLLHHRDRDIHYPGAHYRQILQQQWPPSEPEPPGQLL